MIFLLIFINVVLWLSICCVYLKFRRLEEEQHVLHCEFQALENSLKTKSYRFLSQEEFDNYKVDQRHELKKLLDEKQEEIVDRVKKTKEERWQSLEKAFEMKK